MLNVLVIDAQGGGIGKQVVKALADSGLNIKITAIGTNSAATQAMLKAGAGEGATGENPVRVAVKSADVIIGPIGIVIADSMLGEITAKMAEAICTADATRILIPMNQCSNCIVGVKGTSLREMIDEVVSRVSELQ